MRDDCGIPMRKIITDERIVDSWGWAILAAIRTLALKVLGYGLMASFLVLIVSLIGIAFKYATLASFIVLIAGVLVVFVVTRAEDEFKEAKYRIRDTKKPGE